MDEQYMMLKKREEETTKLKSRLLAKAGSKRKI